MRIKTIALSTPSMYDPELPGMTVAAGHAPRPRAGLPLWRILVAGMAMLPACAIDLDESSYLVDSTELEVTVAPNEVRSSWALVTGSSTGRAWVDFNEAGAGGKADFCRPVLYTPPGATVPERRVRCTESTGDAFGTSRDSGNLDWGDGANPQDRAWADVNGDGRADFCRIKVTDSDANHHTLSCTLSTATGFNLGSTATYTTTLGYEGPRAAGRMWVDMNRDGRADYCRARDGFTFSCPAGGCIVTPSLRCSLSTPQGFVHQALVPSSYSMDLGHDAGRAWADFNGDGTPDYCRVIGNINNHDSRVACTVVNYNDATGTLSLGTTYTSQVIDWGENAGRAWVDIDRPAGAPAHYVPKADFCRVVSSNQLRCLVSNGTGWPSEVIFSVDEVGHESGRAWVDYTGDGNAEYCAVGGSAIGVDSRTFCYSWSNATKYVANIADWGVPESRGWADFNGDGKADFCRMGALRENYQITYPSSGGIDLRYHVLCNISP